MNYHELYSEPRHMRYIFFVDANIQYSDLLGIMKQNLTFWGGALNPIVPVKENVIVDGYLEIIRHFDPDIVYHSAKLDIQKIKNLGLFNPSAYVEFDESGSNLSIAGVSRLHLLYYFDRSRPLIVPKNLWNTNSILLNYYELNFGIRPQAYVGDGKAVFGQMVIHASPENIKDLHYHIHSNKPVDYARLASLYSSNKVLRNLRYFQYDTTELVIAADTVDTQDLLYWWNRKLYEGRKIFIVTRQQLEELVKDKYFGPVLADNCAGLVINVISFSLSQLEVEEIINTSLKSLPPGRVFKYTKVDIFPYPVDGHEGVRDDVEQDRGKNQLILPGESHFSVVTPVFINSTSYSTDTWAVDMQILSVYEAGHVKEIRFPKTTNVHLIIDAPNSRINLKRRITYYYGSNSPHKPAFIELRYKPTFSSILSQLITAPVIDGKVIPSGYTDVEVQDPGNRLLSFLRLFENEFYTLHEYLSDKFWSDLLVEAGNSGKMAGDAITFKELSRRCQYMMARQRIILGRRKKTWRNSENLELGLKPMVADLVSKKVLLPGYTFKCKHCGHKDWYSIEEVAINIQCSGCMENFHLPVDPPISYRLSTLVKRNFYSSPKQPDGNAAVIGALIKLATNPDNHTFEYSGQLDLYNDPRSTKPVTDLDIVALENGRFVIGEAKNNSAELLADKKKSLNQLYEVARMIKPDRIILCCVDDANSNLSKARNLLANRFHPDDKTAPEVLGIQVTQPTYFKFKGGAYFRY
jgi:hypothetical protein